MMLLQISDHLLQGIMCRIKLYKGLKVNLRFVFRPVEESSYFFFSQLWVRLRLLIYRLILRRLNQVRASPTDQQPEVEKVEQGLHRLLRFGPDRAALSFTLFLRLMAILGLLVFGLGFSYCHLLLHLYGGNNLTEGTGPDLLRAQVRFFGLSG